MSDSALTSPVIDVLVANHRQFLDFLQRKIGDRALAEDILQQAFVRGMDRAESVRDSESAVAWFYRILRNAVIDHYRRTGAAKRALDRASAEWQSTSESDAEIHAAVCQCVGQLAATLKPAYADALRLVDVEGTPVKDFADAAGISANNASVRLHRAREALRRRVEQSCGTCAEHGCLDCHCKA